MFPKLHIGPLALPTYGLAVLVAFAVSVWIALRRAPKYGISKSEVVDLAFYPLLAGVVGARLLFILQEFHHMSWKEVLSFRFEGLTSFGGLIGGFIAVVVVCKRRGYSLSSMLDLLFPPFLVGQAIGRVGCVLNGCCFGRECPQDLPWGMHFNNMAEPHHPAQLYESLILVGLFGLAVLLEKRKLPKGVLAAVSVFFAGLARFIYEFWRAGTIEEVKAGVASSTRIGSLPLTEAHLVALALMITGVIAYFICRKNSTDRTIPTRMEEPGVS
jgi:phosphatidylglycerol:prolipoprotein diacylglycerol transferase